MAGRDDIEAMLAAAPAGTPVSVVLLVKVGAESETFSADAVTSGDPFVLAAGLVISIQTNANRYLNKRGLERRTAL